MSVQWQKVHVFISSTFNDMHAERDYLVKRVFPELQDWCERRKLRLVDVDLRWGVTEADATANANVVRTCLKRIDDCRPFFVCLLGQRYGWAPEPKDVSPETLEEYPLLKAALDEGVSVTEMEIRHAIVEPFRDAPADGTDNEHYRLAEHSFFYLRDPGYLDDLPADPPALRRIYTDEAEADKARRVALRCQLRALRKRTIPATGRPVHHYRASWDANRRTPEIELPLACPALLPANVRRWQDDWARALGDDVEFAIGSAGTEADSETRPYRDLVALAEAARNEAEAAVFAAASDARDEVSVKEKAKKAGREAAAEATKGYRELGERWVEQALAHNSRLTRGRLADFAVLDGRCEGNDLAGKDLAQAILCDLKTAIAARFPDHVEVEYATGLQRELDQQEQFLFLSSDGFIECGNDLAELDDYVLGDSQRLLVLTAEGGMGKSMLLANWIDRCRADAKTYPDTTFHARFIGQSDGSSSVAGLLRLLLEEMRDVAGKLPRMTTETQTDPDGSEREVEVPFEIPADPRKVPQFWKEQLPRLGERGQTVIVIDALNQLEGGLRDVSWLPLQGLPPGVKLIVSFRSGAEGAAALIERLERNPQHVQFDDVAPFENVADRKRLVAKYLEQYLKELDDQHVEQLVQAAGAANPLYLKVVLSELRVFGSFTGLREKIEHDFGSTPVTAFGALLRRLEGDPSYTAVDPKEAVPVLFGLLLHARRGLSAGELTELFVDQLKLREQRREYAAEAVQVLLRQAVGFLGRRDGLFDYFFDSFELASRDRYVLGGDRASDSARPKTDLHGTLAGYFAGQPLRQGEDSTSAGNRRKLDELAFQQAGAQEWNTLQATLTDFEFMQAKLERLGLQALIEDYDIARAGGYVERDLAVVQNALHLSANALRQDDRQMPSQLVGRLMTREEPAIQALMNQTNAWSGWPWLRPLSPTLMRAGGSLLHTLEGHTESVMAIALSPDGRRAVSCSKDKTVRVWDLEVGESVHTLTGHTLEVRAVAVSPDGRWAVSCSQDKTVRVWDLETGGTMHILTGHTGSVVAVAMIPNGRRAVSAGDQTLRVWDLETGSAVYTLARHTDRVTAVAVSADGRRAVSGSWDKTVRIWDLETGEPVRTLMDSVDGPTGQVVAVAMSQDGRRVVSADDTAACVWDVETGQLLHTKVSHSDKVVAVVVVPDGRRAVSGSRDCTVRVWDLETEKPLHNLQGHADSVDSVVVSPDGRRAVSGSKDGTVRVWDLVTGETEHVLTGHTGPVTAVVVSPNGRRVVSGSEDGTVRVWDLEASSVRAFSAPTGEPSAVAISPDGRRVASVSKDNSVRIWDSRTGVAVHTLQGYTGSVVAVAVSSDGRRAVWGSEDRTLRLWAMETGEIRTFQGHAGSVVAVALSPDGRRAVSGSEDRTVRLWNLETGETVRTLQGHTGSVVAVAVSSDGRRAVSGSRDGTMRVWNLETGESVYTLQGHTGPVVAVAVSLDGRLGVSGSEDRTVRLWDMESGEAVWITLQGHTGSVVAVAVSPDGRRVVSGSQDKTLRVWNMEKGVRTHRGHTGEVAAVAVSPDGRRAVSISKDRGVRMWDLMTGNEVHTSTGHADAVVAVAVSPDGQRAVSGSDDATACVWDLMSGEAVHTLEGHTGAVTAVTVSADGRRAVSGSRDKTVRVWDLETGHPVCTLEGHTSWVWCVAVSPDRRRAVSGSLDETLHVWDLDTGKAVHILTGHAKAVVAVGVGPDGRWAVSGSDDDTVRVWDLVTGDEVHILKGHTARVMAVAVSPDGRRVVSAGDQTVRVWDLETGDWVHILKGHTARVMAVAVSPDGRRVVSAGDQTVRVWDLVTGDEVHILRGHTGQVKAMVVSPDGQWVVSAGDQTVRMWDLGSGSEVARFSCDAQLVCLQAGIDSLAAGDGRGSVHVLQIQGVNRNPAVVTARIVHAPVEDDVERVQEQLTVICYFCRTVFAVGADTLDTVILCPNCDVRLKLNRLPVAEFTPAPNLWRVGLAQLASPLLYPSPPAKVATPAVPDLLVVIAAWTWLVGVIGIAAYCALLISGSIATKVLVGLASFVLASQLTLSILPSSYGPRLTQRIWNLWILVLVGALQVSQPLWLSGDWLGWVSPVFPLLFGAAAVASVLRLLGRW